MARVSLPVIHKQAEVFRMRMMVEGPSQQGKTGLLTCLPDGTGEAPNHYPALYIAADPTSPALDSVWQEDAERLVVVTPNGRPSDMTEMEWETGRQRWYDEAVEISTADWKTWGAGCDTVLGVDTEGKSIVETCRRKWPDGVKTIIVDTISEWSKQVFYQNCREQNSPADQKTGLKPAIGSQVLKNKYLAGVAPGRTDYNHVQGYMDQILTFLFNHDVNLLVGSQEGVWEPPQGTNEGGAIGGYTVGGGSIKKLAQRFGLIARVSQLGYDVPDGMMKVQVKPSGLFLVNFKGVARAAEVKDQFLPNTAEARRGWWEWAWDLKTNKTRVEVES